MKKALGFAMIISTFIFSCSEDDKPLNNESIIYQEENILITLVDIDDERCPTNVDCVWQGNAEVEMKITNGDETTDFKLNTAGFINENANFPTGISIFDLNIELLNLQPYPEDTNQIPTDEYDVIISVN